jgi:Fe-S-cluster-containing hydrogenase component 2
MGADFRYQEKGWRTMLEFDISAATLKPGRVKLQLTAELCQGCRACEAVCSTYHLGFNNPFGTGIHIYEKAELGNFVQVACVQCVDMPCAEACPTGAIIHNSYSGAVEITDDCNLCGSCVDACPIHAIWIAPSQSIKKAVKCDLCGGLPQCVAVCPRQALAW